jgi:hypothetical protein
MDLALRHYQDGSDVKVEKLTLVDIYSLSLRDDFFKPISWKINTGFARTRLRDGEHGAVYRTNGGAGMAWGDWGGAAFYVFMEGTLDAGGGLDSDYALGVGPSLGLFAHPLAPWKMNLFARLQDYFAGDRRDEVEFALQQSLSFGRQHALRLTLEDHHERGIEWTAAELGWYWYF